MFLWRFVTQIALTCFISWKMITRAKNVCGAIELCFDEKKCIFCLCVRRKHCLPVLVLKEWCINCREREKKLAELRSLKSDFKPGVWNVNAVLLGGLGKEPEVDGKDLPVCSLFLPAIKRCLKISFWFFAVHWNQMQSEWTTLRRFYHALLM